MTMARSKLAPLKIALSTLTGLFVTFRSQKMSWALLLALMIFVISLIFAFLSFTPILSPFIYPLF